MTAKYPRRCEFAQLVTDHVLRHEQLDELPTVVHHERVPHEVRHDRAIARPRLERLAAARALLALHLTQQALADVRSLLDRTAHLTLSDGVDLFYATGHLRPAALATSWCRRLACIPAQASRLQHEITSVRNAVRAGGGE